MNRCVFLIVVLAVVLLLCTPFAEAFGGGGFQKNPFMSKSDNERLQILQAKAEANSNVADPMPGQPLPGTMTALKNLLR